jgi:hypothetical protein
MTLPITLAVLGVIALLAGELLARRASRLGIGRTLSAARTVSIEKALEIAASGQPRYVKVHGRISSDEEFPDEHDRPLVYRRKRLQWQEPDGKWKTSTGDVEGVPFGIESRDTFIGIDSAKLTNGLLVVPRTAEGTATDLPADYRSDLPPEVPPTAPTRLVIEQVSAVEHATVSGVPTMGSNGQPTMTSGFGRPLILTTLEVADAMRLIGGGRVLRAFASAALYGLGVLLLIGAGIAFLLWAVAPVLAQGALATPTPTPAPLATPFDPRGGGNGPGVVGSPFFAALVVVALGVAAALATGLYVRLAQRR